MISSDIHNASSVEILYRDLLRSTSRLKNAAMPQKILSGQRVSIPDPIIKEWGLQAGDYVLVKKEGKGMYIVPARFEEA